MIPVVQSRQNVSTSSSSGWAFSVTFNGSTGQRLWIALSDATVMGTFEGIGLITSAVIENGEERQAIYDLAVEISNDTPGFPPGSLPRL
ncbi:MAG: hypothetical protein GY943_24620, partial [Chloroflexi bacterium]|nr:hypothetical protein [Chloroflexota bacterium]